MVAINSIPQQLVANGNGQIELLRAKPTTFDSCMAMKPSPSKPPGDSTNLILVLCVTGLLDRKSTRLNSSHVAISYAVFCLKKKKKRYIVVLHRNANIA